MSNRKGRCFRSPRRTARRKARQAVAMEMLRREVPNAPIFAFDRPRRGVTAAMMSEDSRFKLMKHFARIPLTRLPRRAARGG
jgi:hypothetical protein